MLLMCSVFTFQLTGDKATNDAHLVGDFMTHSCRDRPRRTIPIKKLGRPITRNHPLRNKAPFSIAYKFAINSI
ncbi:hypothetical protein HanRHA438_Chr08g0366161 [Helianthus annuus]|nr:hypothetical protein HanRHA438_Chr08g0366161 [Helianthus annuus]